MANPFVDGTPFSVVIPAYNESGVIERCLRELLAGAPPGREPEIIVACNGCSDDTADIARSVSPLITVIDLTEGSKPAALNAGNSAATALPRFFVDADVVVGYQDLLEVASRLRGGNIEAAAPSLFVDTNGASPLVKSFYRVWCKLPYITNALVGSGVYGLSKSGLARVGRFPNIISDDGYVRSRFTPDERASVFAHPDGRPVRFTVFPPRTFRSLISIEIRKRAGVEELRSSGYVEKTSQDNTIRSILAAKKSPEIRWWDIVLYVFAKLSGRLLQRINKIRGRGKVWWRDESSRISR